MDYQAFFSARESCRKYQEKTVDKETLTRVVEAALSAPSACNSQPWHFTVVTKKELLPILAESTQNKVPGINRFASQCPAFIIITEQPAWVLDTQGGMKFDQKYAQVDLGLATMQLCLAATAEGLGTCIMGAFDEEMLRAHVTLPEDGVVRLIIAIGYPVHPEARKKVRRTTAEIITYID